MLAQFRIELSPQTAVEDLLVQRIALYAVRLQRAASLSAEYMLEAMRREADDADCDSPRLGSLAFAMRSEHPMRTRISDLKDAVRDLPDAMRQVLEGDLLADNKGLLIGAINRFSTAVESLPDRRRGTNKPLEAIDK